MNVAKESWYTRLAAPIRSAGILTRVFRNHSPIVSPINNTTHDSANITLSDVENTRLSFSVSPFPSSKVKNREMELVRAPDIIANMATNPPTTL